MTTDLTADDDSIQIVAFFSVPHPLGDSSITTNSIGWRLDYGDAFLEGTTDIEVEDHDLDTVRQSYLNMVGARSYKYAGGSNAAERLHQVPNLISF